MANAPVEPVASVPWRAAPVYPLRGASTRRQRAPRRRLSRWAARATRSTPEQVSLGRRLRQPRTIISILVPLAIIVAFVYLNGEHAVQVPSPDRCQRTRPWSSSRSSSSTCGFPLRGCAGRSSCAGPGFRIGTKDSTEILFLSWLVNCVVPAKLGDVYRAYLLKINSTASLSRTFGTVFIERILDLFAIAHARHRGRLLELPRRAAAGDPGRLHRRHRRGRSARHRAASRCATSGAGSSSRCPLPHDRPRALRPVRGRRLRGHRAPAPAGPRPA